MCDFVWVGAEVYSLCTQWQWRHGKFCIQTALWKECLWVFHVLCNVYRTQAYWRRLWKSKSSLSTTCSTWTKWTSIPRWIRSMWHTERTTKRQSHHLSVSTGCSKWHSQTDWRKQFHFLLVTSARWQCVVTGRMGCATYVTKSMSVALEHAPEDPEGNRWLFVCDALIGHFCQGRSGQVEPPFQDEKTFLRYDSTVDSEANPTKYALFSDHQSLLRYLIKFQKKTSLPAGIFKLLS